MLFRLITFLFFMLSPLEICNRALSKLGQRHITGLDKTQDPISQQCALLYHPARREVLCACRWSFAVKASVLKSIPKSFYKTQTIPPPFSFAYELPEACLRVLDVPLKKWSLSGRQLMTMQEGNARLTITYIEDSEMVEDWDPLFTEALVCRLAEKLCLPVTGSHTLRQNLLNEYNKVLLPQAAHINQVQHCSNDQHPLYNLLNNSIFHS